MRSCCRLGRGRDTGTVLTLVPRWRPTTSVRGPSMLSCSQVTPPAAWLRALPTRCNCCAAVLKRIVWGLPSDVWPVALCAAALIMVPPVLSCPSHVSEPSSAADDTMHMTHGAHMRHRRTVCNCEAMILIA